LRRSSAARSWYVAGGRPLTMMGVQDERCTLLVVARTAQRAEHE
jgi:hypothetical protein